MIQILIETNLCCLAVPLGMEIKFFDQIINIFFFWFFAEFEKTKYEDENAASVQKFSSIGQEMPQHWTVGESRLYLSIVCKADHRVSIWNLKIYFPGIYITGKRIFNASL